MVDKITKLLLKLNKKEQRKLEDAFEAVRSDWRKAGDVKPLTGKKNMFRLRTGVFRIVFEVKNEKVIILYAGKRNDTFYN